MIIGIVVLPALGTAAVETASYLLWGTYPHESLSLGFGITVAELGWMLGFYHFALFFQLLVWPALVRVASSSYLADGTAETIGSILRPGGRWKGWLGLAAVLFLLILVLPEFAGAGLFVGTAFVLSEVLMQPSALMEMVLPPVLIAVCIGSWMAMGWMGATFSFSLPARMQEGVSVRNAMRRGRELSRASRLRVSAAWLIPAGLAFLLSLTLTRAATSLSRGCPLESDGTVILLRIAGWTGWCVSPGMVEEIRIVCEAIMTGALTPIFPMALTVFYYDQRIRREGFDIEMMMDAAGMNAAGMDAAGMNAAGMDAAGMNAAEAAGPGSLPGAAAESGERSS